MKTLEALMVHETVSLACAVEEELAMLQGPSFDEPYKLEWYPELTEENMRRVRVYLNQACELIERMKRRG